MSPEEALQKVRSELKSLFIERDALVDGALLGVLSQQHVLMLGPPGTAKSMLAKEVCRRLSGKRYFEWLLTKFSTPEEPFGPISIAALEEGRYERVMGGKLPEAEVVFLDEVFKANSAILNALLAILNERVFHQGTQVIKVPLEVMLAAANELPEEDELGALYDRFLLRFTVGYIEHDHQFQKLLMMPSSSEAPIHSLGAADLASLQSKVQQVPVPEGVIKDLVEIREKLAEDGVVASDRRYRLALSVLRAAAVLEGRERVSFGDLRWLEHLLWSDPEERPKVQKVLSDLATGLEEEGRKLLSQAQEIDAFARRGWPDALSASRAVLEAHLKLEDIKRRMRALLDAGAQRHRDLTWLEEAGQKVAALQERLLSEKH